MNKQIPLEPYVAYWRERRTAQQAHNRHLATRAYADAQRIAVMLRREYGVTRILLFGSLVRDAFLPDSDIDLAVADLPPARFFTALAQAAVLSDFPVDIKPLEALDAHFKARVLATGEEI